MKVWGSYLIAIVSIFLSFTINYASAEIDILLTPPDVVFNNHAFIVDIIDPNAAGTIPITIRAASGDIEQINVNFDPLWGKYRLVISTATAGPNSGDSLIQASQDDIITVEYGADPSKWKSLSYNTIHAEGPTGNRWTFSTNIGCPQQNPADSDMDGICDTWENHPNGLVIEDLDGVDPFVPGRYTFDCTLSNGERCGSDKPDIFLEIDWIQSHKPDPKAIQQVIDAFANARESNIGIDGIRLHIQVDPLSAFPHHPIIYFPGYDINGYRGYDQLKANAFGTPSERNNPNIDWNEVRKLKHQVFHYGLFAHQMQGNLFQTGVGEIIGNDFLITLAKYVGKNGSTDQQAGTLMHELGHNLGLNHGGGEFDEINNKPNYFSVMTYTRQFADLDANRKLDYSNATLGHHHTSPPQDTSVAAWGLHEETIQGFARGVWEYPGHETEKIIFSCPDGQTAPLLYFTGPQGGVDWDCDNTPEELGRIQAHINNFTTFPNTVIERFDGHNDWASLNFYFSDNADNYADGLHLRVAGGVALSGGDGIPFGETSATLAANGSSPDLGYSFVTTGQEELTFEKVTLNRISNLLSLYRQIAMFDETDFSSSNSTKITNVQYNTNELKENDQKNQEQKKNSFKEAILQAIDQINIQDIQNAQKTVQSIDAALEASLSETQYTEKIHPLTSNLIGTYEKALGFGLVSPLQEIENKPIIEEDEIIKMIKNVEEFVSDVKSSKGIQCNLPFQTSDEKCVCPAGMVENKEKDCVIKLLSPLQQFKSGIPAEEVECKVGFERLLKTTTETPACVSLSTAIELVSHGWGTRLP